MSRLKKVIVFTPDMDSMRSFYENGVGLRTTIADPHWTSFETGGASLALHPLPDGREREIELAFETPAIDAEVERLRAHGVETGEIRSGSSGRVIQFRDLEGNRLSIRQPEDRGRAPGEVTADPEIEVAPALAQVIINCKDLAGALAFYRERLGLRVAYEAAHWVELDSGVTRLALHARPTGLNHPLHAAQRVAYCLEAPDLDAWVEEMRARGLHFATAPIEEEFGLYAEALDPDGNVVVFQAPRETPSLEEELAEPPRATSSRGAGWSRRAAEGRSARGSSPRTRATPSVRGPSPRSAGSRRRSRRRSRTRSGRRRPPARRDP